MKSDETQFGLKLTGVLRPKVKAEAKLPPSTGKSPVTEKLPQPMSGAPMPSKMTEVAKAVEKQAAPPLPSDWREPVAQEQVDRVQPDEAEYLQSLSAAARGHRSGRKSGHSRTLYWLMGLGISVVTAGLLIGWIYWQPLSALLVGGPVTTTPQETVAIAGPKSKPSPAVPVPPAKPVVVANHSGAVPQAGPTVVQPVATPVIKPAAAPVVKPVARKQPPASASLDLDHPFFQRIKGPFPQLFKTSTGN